MPEDAHYTLLRTIEQNPVRTTPAPTGGRAPSGPTRTAWAIVARREILAKIFDKSFLVGTVLTVAVIAGFMVVLALITYVPELVLWLPNLVYGPPL